MCTKFKNDKYINDIDSITNYIVNKCNCNHCSNINKKYKSLKIILYFLYKYIIFPKKIIKRYYNKSLQANLLIEYKKTAEDIALNLIFKQYFILIKKYYKN